MLHWQQLLGLTPGSGCCCGCYYYYCCCCCDACGEHQACGPRGGPRARRAELKLCAAALRLTGWRPPRCCRRRLGEGPLTVVIDPGTLVGAAVMPAPGSPAAVAAAALQLPRSRCRQLPFAPSSSSSSSLLPACVAPPSLLCPSARTQQRTLLPPPRTPTAHPHSHFFSAAAPLEAGRPAAAAAAAGGAEAGHPPVLGAGRLPGAAATPPHCPCAAATGVVLPATTPHRPPTSCPRATHHSAWLTPPPCVHITFAPLP